MVRPLHRESTNILAEMTDSQLDRLSYYLRVAYAAQLNAGGNGSISIGSSHTSIGSLQDTIEAAQTASQARDNTGGPDYPTAPGTTETNSDTLYEYQQKRTVPSFPSSSVLNSDGYVYYSSGEIIVASTAAHLYDEIISQTITDMRTGDEVGTYRIDTATPTQGGNGTWTDKGEWFVDHVYGSGNTVAQSLSNQTVNATYKLYLRTAMDTVPGTDVFPIGLDTTDLKERGILNSENLIQNVLLPALTRRISDGDLQYSVVDTVTGIDRGTFINTRKQGTPSVTKTFDGSTYFTISRPTGSATADTGGTKKLNLS